MFMYEQRRRKQRRGNRNMAEIQWKPWHYSSFRTTCQLLRQNYGGSVFVFLNAFLRVLPYAFHSFLFGGTPPSLRFDSADRNIQRTSFGIKWHVPNVHLFIRLVHFILFLSLIWMFCWFVAGEVVEEERYTDYTRIRAWGRARMWMWMWT